MALEQSRRAGGIDVANLFRWNSLMLRLDGSAGHYAEYVHIRHGSATVKVGDKVTAGQVLCEAGDAGFCPTPHLHLQLHECDDPAAPTVPFGFVQMTASGTAGDGDSSGGAQSNDSCAPCAIKQPASPTSGSSGGGGGQAEGVASVEVCSGNVSRRQQQPGGFFPVACRWYCPLRGQVEPP